MVRCAFALTFAAGIEQAGAIEGLVHLLEAPAAQPRALADAVFALKRLTAADRRSRAAFVAAAGPDALLRLLDAQQHQLVAPVPCFPLLEAAAARPGAAGLPPRSPMCRPPPRSPLGSIQDLQQLPSRGSPSRRGSEAGSASQACTPERPGPLAASAQGTPPRGSAAGGASGEYGPQMQYSAARILRHLALDGDAGHKTAARTCLPALVHALKVLLQRPCIRLTLSRLQHCLCHQQRMHAICSRHFPHVHIRKATGPHSYTELLPLFGLQTPNPYSSTPAAKGCMDAQGAKPRVAFALASAISAAVEGSADAAQLVADSGGIALLVRIMRHGSGHGKKAAAEVLQVLSLRPVLNSWCLVHVHDACVSVLIRCIRALLAQ